LVAAKGNTVSAECSGSGDTSKLRNLNGAKDLEMISSDW